MFKEFFTQEELNIARQNGFILTGKTGSGKSTLLNVLFNKKVTEAKPCAFAVTKNPSVFYLKLKNGTCISLVDTPGLSDPEITSRDETNLDEKHLKDIEKVISEEKIHIKGILFLVNFQIERFDNSEQEALICYNKIFPLKRFWKHLIVIFTHHYGDPNGDTTEEMIQNRDESNGQIFTLLMKRVKNVSDVIDYRDLRVKYYNSYSSVKNHNQEIVNNKNKEDLEILINELCQSEPLFCQIEIIHVKNEKIKENGQTFLVEYERIGFFDFNHNPLKEKINLIKKEPINDDQEVPLVSQEVKVFAAQSDSSGNLNYSGEKGNKNNSKYLKNGVGGGLGAILGAGLGVVGGLAYAGGIAGGGVGLGAAIAAGAAAGAAAIAAPIAIGVGIVGIIGTGIGLGISKLFN